MIDPATSTHQRERVAVALTLEEWQTVLHWLTYGADYHDAKKWECLGNIKDQATAGRQAAEHEKAGAETARLYKIIEGVLIPSPPPETE